jgi:hypothetical protein
VYPSILDRHWGVLWCGPDDKDASNSKKGYYFGGNLRMRAAISIKRNLTLQKEKKLQEQRQAQPVYAAHRWLRWLRRSKSGPPPILLFLLAPSSEKYQTFIGCDVMGSAGIFYQGKN